MNVLPGRLPCHPCIKILAYITTPLPVFEAWQASGGKVIDIVIEVIIVCRIEQGRWRFAIQSTNFLGQYSHAGIGSSIVGYDQINGYVDHGAVSTLGQRYSGAITGDGIAGYADIVAVR